MTAIESPKPSLYRNRLVWQGLCVVALLMIAGRLWIRSQPERLTTLPAPAYDNGYYKVAGDDLVMFVYPDPSRYTAARIQIQSIQNHETRTLVPDDPAYELYRPYSSGSSIGPLPYLWSMAAGELYYAVVPRSPRGVFLHVDPIARGLSPGVFLLPPKNLPDKEIDGQTRTKIKEWPLPAQDLRFRQISLQGGASREVAALRGENFCMVGNHLFWIRPAAEVTVEVTRLQNNRKRISWLETTAHSDLMLTSLTDGTTRCIRHGISRDPYLRAIASGVIWSEFAPYPEKPTNFYARASDGAILAMKPLTAGRVPRLLLESGGRFYWTDSRYESEVYQFSHDVLMSSNLDGTDIREVLQKAEERFVSNLSLSSYRGELYCRLEELPMTDQDHPRSLLCRLHPDRSEPIEIVRTLPPGSDAAARFDGGYLYFVLQEQKRRLQLPLTVTYTPTLFRVPLDH
jgi:hypothetical protein